MPYFTQSQITSRIPLQTLVEALDDDGDGAIDTEVWDALVEDSSNKVDALLGQRFTVPFADPVPPIVKEVARIFCLELVFIRRGYHTDDDNPWAKPARDMKMKLTRIANSDEPLMPSTKGSGSVKIISEPSRTQSSGGYFAT